MEPKKTVAKAITAISMDHFIESPECAVSQVPAPRSKTARRIPAKINRIKSIAQAAAATSPIIRTAVNTRRPNRETSGVIRKTGCMRDSEKTPLSWGGRELFDQVPHFLFVILTIEDFPFPAAFGNRAFLRFDFVPGGL